MTSEYLSEPEELPLEDVVVEGIGSAGRGVTYSEAAEAMLLPVLAAARSAAAERLRSVAAKVAADAAREELGDDVDELRDKADDAEQRVGEKLEGLLDRG